MQSIVLGGGCFWCLEAVFQLIDGVIEVIPGYAGGDTDNPTYEAVSSGKTRHAEVVKVVFDSNKIGLAGILEIFWVIHDPTTVDQQGYDIGSNYRSVIYYNDSIQEAIIHESLNNVKSLWNDPIVTEVEMLKKFFPAEAYHHNYFKNHPELAYCQVVINPKLKKLRDKFKSRLKT